MTASFTANLRFAKPGKSDVGWAQLIDTMFDLIDSSIAGVTSVITSGGTTILTTNDNATDQARQPIIIVSGVLSSAAVIVIPNSPKQYTVLNKATGAFPLTVTTNLGGVGAVVLQGAAVQLASDAGPLGNILFVSPQVDFTTGLIKTSAASNPIVNALIFG